MAEEKWLGANAPHAQRIRLLWDVLGYPTQAVYAEKLGISAQRLNNLLQGAPLSKDVAFKLVNLVPGLTLDWLWFGKTNGLSFHLAEKLRAREPS